MSSESELWGLIGTKGLGVIVALKRDGRPQLSNINYAADATAGLIRISTTADRAKVHNLRRDPRASLYVNRPDGWSYAVAEGTAELSPVAEKPDDATVEALVKLYRDAAGEHPDWDDYRAAMVRDRRLVLTLHVERLYGWAAGS